VRGVVGDHGADAVHAPGLKLLPPRGMRLVLLLLLLLLLLLAHHQLLGPGPRSLSSGNPAAADDASLVLAGASGPCGDAREGGGEVCPVALDEAAMVEALPEAVHLDHRAPHMRHAGHRWHVTSLQELGGRGGTSKPGGTARGAGRQADSTDAMWRYTSVGRASSSPKPRLFPIC